MSQALDAKPGLQYGRISVKTPVVLAPMAGITNTAFRRLCREFGGGLYVSEMVTSRALVERTEESLRLVGHHPSEEIRSVQLYGVEPKTVAAAVTMLVAEDRADHIDLNFGCPVPKVTRTGGGSALPWKRGLLRAIVREAVAASEDAARAVGREPVPVTVKMRLGWDDACLQFHTQANTVKTASYWQVRQPLNSKASGRWRAGMWTPCASEGTPAQTEPAARSLILV